MNPDVCHPAWNFCLRPFAMFRFPDFAQQKDPCRNIDEFRCSVGRLVFVAVPSNRRFETNAKWFDGISGRLTVGSPYLGQVS